MTKEDIKEIARSVADEMEARLFHRIHRSANGNLVLEMVEVNTLPVSLRGGMSHD